MAQIVDACLQLTVPGGVAGRARLLGCQAALAAAAGQAQEAQALLTSQACPTCLVHASALWETGQIDGEVDLSDLRLDRLMS